MAQFSTLWTWFGKVVQSMRYKRHISGMWQAGVICLLVPTARICDELRQHPSGSAVVFFSERNAGSYAVLYSTDGGSGATSSGGDSLLAPQQAVASASDTVPTDNSGVGSDVVADSNGLVIKHYELKFGDTFGAKRTLAHFLLACEQFKYILVLLPNR